MGTRYSTVTYKEILDQVLSDLRDPRLTNLPTKVVVRHINDAQEQICKWMGIEYQQDLRLITGQTDYYFADSTGITGTGTLSSVGTAITGVGTSFLSQFVAGSKLHISGQTVIVKSVTSDTACVSETALSPAMPASTPFTFDGRASEITTEMRSIKDAERLEGSYVRSTDITGRSQMVKLKVIEGFPVSTNYDTPSDLTIGRKVGGRYVAFHPPPDSDKTITVYGYLVINPFLHKDDALTDNIILGQEWAATIRHYLAAMLKGSFLADEKGKAQSLNQFGPDARQTHRSMASKTVISIDYE